MCSYSIPAIHDTCLKKTSLSRVCCNAIRPSNDCWCLSPCLRRCPLTDFSRAYRHCAANLCWMAGSTCRIHSMDHTCTVCCFFLPTMRAVIKKLQEQCLRFGHPWEGNITPNCMVTLCAPGTGQWSRHGCTLCRQHHAVEAKLFGDQLQQRTCQCGFLSQAMKACNDLAWDCCGNGNSSICVMAAMSVHSSAHLCKLTT